MKHWAGAATLSLAVISVFCALSTADQLVGASRDEIDSAARAELAVLAHDAQEAQEQGNLALTAELHEKMAKRSGNDSSRAILHYSLAIELRGALGQLSEQALDFNLRGHVFRSSLDYAEARADYLKAQEIAARAGNRVYQAVATNNLGLLEEDAGNFAGARLAYESALDQLADLQGVEESRIKFLRNLAQIYRIEGNFQEALVLLERARTLCTPKLNGLKGAILSDLGFFEQLRKRYTAALGYFLDALSFLSTMSSADQIILFDRFGSNLLISDRPAEARQAFLHAIELARSSALTSLEIGSRINLCKFSVLYPDLEPTDAKISCEEALEAVQSLPDPNRKSSFYYWQARYFSRLGRLREAIAAAETAVNLIDSLRSRISGRNGRSRFLEDRSFYFRHLIDLLMAAHQADSHQGYDIRALEVGERLRARTLLEIWAEAGVDLLDSADPKLRNEFENKLKKLEFLETRRSDPGNQARISELLTQLDALDQRLRESSPNFLRVVRPRPISIAEVQKDLGEDTALVLLSFGEKSSYLFLIDSKQIRSFKTASAADLEGAAEAYLQMLSDPEGVHHQAALFRAGTKLARLLWGENAERLAGLPSRLLFLGDGKLQQFPISALPQLGSNPDLPHYFLETFEVVHLPALSLLERFHDGLHQAPTRNAIILGDPAYRLEAHDAIRMFPLPQADIERYFPNSATLPALGRLPFADVEAERIRARFGKLPIEVALGPRASKNLAMSSEISLYSIVHLSSHGTRDPDHAELSALMLSEVDEEGKQIDGNLRLQDLYRLRLRADLVVASACQTGIGGNLRLEGVGGLAQGFFQAGARRTLVSLWQVESESTSILMDHFYKHLLAGKPPGQALRHASLDLIALARPQRKSWDRPFFWSPFILIGDWSAFELPKNSPSTEQSH